MSERSKMDAKDIAALFRSAVEAENKDFFEDTNTFAEQDFFTQLGWFTNQIEARLTKNTPSPNILALMAALGGAIGRSEPESCIDEAYEIWQVADKRIREEALCSREEIEENLSQVGVYFRLTPWPKNDDGTERKNSNLIPFLRLCIPRTGQDALKARFQEYLKDNPFGKKCRTPAQVERELKAVTNKLFILDDFQREGTEIVRWWMNQEAFDPLSFPKGSYGDLAKRALGLAEPREEPEEEPKKG
ncbi:hypothetical protein OAG28_02325 [Akkermansiaceae bacterium]|nr:hypothetical protein [Akkermansiaceae bacterium]